MYKITEFSKMVGLTARVLRHYESLDLIAPQRVGKDYRSYSESDINQVSQIKFLQQLGFSLKEVKLLLTLGTEQLQSRLSELYSKKEQESECLTSQIDLIRDASSMLATHSITIDELIKVPSLSVGEREELLSVTELKERTIRGRAPLIELLMMKFLEEISDDEMEYKIVSIDNLLYKSALNSMPGGYTAIYECKQGNTFFYLHSGENYLLNLSDESSEQIQTLRTQMMYMMEILEKWWSKAYVPMGFSFCDITSDITQLLDVYGAKEVVMNIKIEVTNKADGKENIHIGLPAPFLYTVNHARLWELHRRSGGDEEKVLEILADFYRKDTVHYIMNDIKNVVG